MEGFSEKKRDALLEPMLQEKGLVNGIRNLGPWLR